MARFPFRCIEYLLMSKKFCIRLRNALLIGLQVEIEALVFSVHKISVPHNTSYHLCDIEKANELHIFSYMHVYTVNMSQTQSLNPTSSYHAAKTSIKTKMGIC